MTQLTIDEMLKPGLGLTFEEYQTLYYYKGIGAMITKLKEQFHKSTPNELNQLIQAILYGYKYDGTPMTKPRIPDPYLMTTNEFLYDFQCKVWKNYVKKETKQQCQK